jgi:hypothetical protein
MVAGMQVDVAVVAELVARCRTASCRLQIPCSQRNARSTSWRCQLSSQLHGGSLAGSTRGHSAPSACPLAAALSEPSLDGLPQAQPLKEGIR